MRTDAVIEVLEVRTVEPVEATRERRGDERGGVLPEPRPAPVLPARA